MLQYELVVAILDKDGRPSGQVRAWIDKNLENDLASERELKLQCDDGRWSGRFQVSESRWPRFGFRLGLLAPEGAVWNLLIRPCDSQHSGRPLLEDSDVMADSKQWLLGTCDAVASETDADAIDRLKRRRRRAAHGDVRVARRS